MHSLQKQFHDFIHTNHLVKKDEKVLLAVSGGLDSMVLAHLFLSEKIPFDMAHCNYGLRGEESDGDEAFVMNWTHKHNINCYVKAMDVSNGSIQLEARNARYGWFNELALEHKFGKIATAHHLNDSLETVLINLSRGTGIKGLSGISVKNDNIIRPLLFADKKALHDYAMDEGLEWREDSSNQRADYDRNHIRHHVIPELLKLNPSLLKTFGLTSERLTHASELVSKKVEEIRKQYLREEKNGFQLDMSWVHEPTDELILAELLKFYGVNYITSKEIFEARGKSGKSFPSEEWLITMDRDALFIDRSGQSDAVAIEIESFGEYSMGDRKLIIEKIKKEEVVFGASNVAHFDGDLLNFPVTIRSWKDGDRFQPLGMKGEKKVSDFLIDEKVPQAIKKNVLILASMESIVWLIGMRISEVFKVSEDTVEVIKVTVLEEDS